MLDRMRTKIEETLEELEQQVVDVSMKIDIPLNTRAFLHIVRGDAIGSLFSNVSAPYPMLSIDGMPSKDGSLSS